MEDRHGVDQLGLITGQQLFQYFHIHPVPVHGYGHDFRPGQTESLYGRKEGGFFDYHHIPGIDESPCNKVNALLRTG